MNKYFVTFHGVRQASNLTKELAIEKAKEIHQANPNDGGIAVGIGVDKIKKGKRVYTLLPYHYYLD